jgi:hypothetical protein
MKKRKIDTENQSEWAKAHYSLSGIYLNDIDGIFYQSTSDSTFTQYVYTDDKDRPIIHRLVEVKFRANEEIRAMILGERAPSPQVQAYISLMREVNMGRSMLNKPELSFYFVVLTEGDWPFHVFDVSEEANFKYVATCHNNEEYKKIFGL